MSDHDTLDVWLAGKYAGKLHRGEEGLVEFVYDETYMASPSSTPLSLSMPLGRIGHGYLTTQAWTENLIPENAKTKDLWARHFGETRTDAFSLLKHMGLDAPGAAQIVREGATLSGQGGFEGLSENQIATRLRDIRETGTTWNLDDDDDIRYSLAGQQSKQWVSACLESAGGASLVLMWFRVLNVVPCPECGSMSSLSAL